MRLKHLVAGVLVLFVSAFLILALVLLNVSSNLPKLVTVADYKPLVVSEIFDSSGEKIGEFFREKRIVVPYDQIPEKQVMAFVAAEDGEFFQHGGINYLAVMRAVVANLKAGRKAQGGSTITQQVARSLLLSSEKTYTRKIKEVLLSYRMEANLSKQDILYLYLNQIYLGEGAYGVAAASKVYFRKALNEMTLPEMAILAGLPQAPSRYSPLDNPSSAKARQKYVLGRMLAIGAITQKEHDEAVAAPVKIYARQKFHEIAPFFVETLRQHLVKTLGENKVLDEGIRIETGLNKKLQLEAQEQVVQGLRALDKRQGFRGAVKNISDVNEVAELLLKTRNHLMDEASPELILQPDGTLPARGPLALQSEPIKDKNGKLKNLPDYIKISEVTDGIVTKVDDKWGLVTVRFAENQGLIDFETMKWARKPNPEVAAANDELKKPSLALKAGDVIQIRIVSDRFFSDKINEKIGNLKKDWIRLKKKEKFQPPADLPDFAPYVGLELEQEPIGEGALLSLDLKTQEVLAMVGGYNFERSEFNRALQATRQTGSSFKPIVYLAGLDNGFNPASVIIDAPLVYEEALPPDEVTPGDTGEQTRLWKPGNYGKTFGGDVLFRNAIISSLNIPTVKILEEVGVSVAAEYARRLGVFSPLNMDLSLGLGSSSVTLYEMTKVFGQIARLGRRLSPQIIRKVTDREGHVLMSSVSLDSRFESELTPLENGFEERRLAYINELQAAQGTTPPPTTGAETPATPAPPKKKSAKIFFEDKDQLVDSKTAYLLTSLLRGVIFDPGGTGAAARAIGRPAAGKTGTTSNYYDTWFMGYTPQIVTGVWVGYDNEKSLGVGETGGRTALPIWLEYMKVAHEDLPRLDFPAPDGIVFANIDNQTGKLASASSQVVVKQAFLEGTEPSSASNEKFSAPGEEKDFYKEDLSE